ncbi:MAG: PD-(D/E)XK nuclease family protein, partial [Acidobacteriaceae bacterium]|nr:PD-(D/E)XK nuclease family protein [Acidobacteriaceae bacterium]
ELSVFAALKGSLFGLPDSKLLKHRLQAKALHPFRCNAGLPDVNQALQILAALHRERNQRPIADTVAALLESCRAHAAFALRPAGHQVLANVQRVITLARNFEAGGGISFRSFVEELNDEAEGAQSAEAPVLEEGAEGVRIMTVHNAKGLEFPVVVLADMTCRLCPDEPSRFIDSSTRLCATRLLGCAPEELRDHAADENLREESEGVRLAYVAATRARDLLVVPACGDAEREGWLAPLNKALYPPYPRRRHARPAPGCPEFGDRTVLARPHDHPDEDECSVMPGAHTPQHGDHEVVWWDPAILNLKRQRRPGILFEQALVAGDQAAKSVAAYQAWKIERQNAIEQGSRKMFEVFTPSEATQPREAFVIRVETLPRPERRPAGRVFGSLVHAILRDAELHADALTLESLAKSNGRALGASDAEISAAAVAASSALKHPLVTQALNSPRVHREFPVTLPVEQCRMLEGTLDLAYLHDGRWTIIDFKTDANLEQRKAQYETQLQWYCLALSRITGQPAEAVLLSI